MKTSRAPPADDARKSPEFDFKAGSDLAALRNLLDAAEFV
jgi:hypothetical protein